MLGGWAVGEATRWRDSRRRKGIAELLRPYRRWFGGQPWSVLLTKGKNPFAVGHVQATPTGSLSRSHAVRPNQWPPLGGQQIAAGGPGAHIIWVIAVCCSQQINGKLHPPSGCEPPPAPAGAVGARRDAPREPPLPEDLVALAASKMKLDKAIAALRRYSLLARDGDTVSLHRLVQTVARDQMPKETLAIWLEVAINSIKIVFRLSLLRFMCGKREKSYFPT